jgi:hypothetical protein
VKEFPIGDYFTRLGRRGEPFDLAVSGWYFGSTDPILLLKIFDGSTIRAAGNLNFSYFNDRAFNRQLAAVAKLSGAKRYRAAGPARARARARRCPGRRDHDDGEPGLLLGEDRVSGLPAGLRHGPRCTLLARLTCVHGVHVAKMDASFGPISTHLS